MRIIQIIADAMHAMSSVFLGLRFIVITLAIAIVLAFVFTLYC